MDWQSYNNNRTLVFVAIACVDVFKNALRLSSFLAQYHRHLQCAFDNIDVGYCNTGVVIEYWNIT